MLRGRTWWRPSTDSSSSENVMIFGARIWAIIWLNVSGEVFSGTCAFRSTLINDSRCASNVESSSQMEICAGMLLSWVATSYTEDFWSAFSDLASRRPGLIFLKSVFGCMCPIYTYWLVIWGREGFTRAGHESWISTTEDGGAPSITTVGPEKGKEKGFCWGDGFRNNGCDGELVKDG